MSNVSGMKVRSPRTTVPVKAILSLIEKWREEASELKKEAGRNRREGDSRMASELEWRASSALVAVTELRALLPK